MSQKLNDIDNDRKNQITEEIESASSALGMDSWEPMSTNYKMLEEQIGICWNCKNLSYCKTEFESVYAKCEAFELRLSGQNRIAECNLHAPKGVLTLNEMYAMAYIIDPQRVSGGFITTDPKFMKKEKKDD